MPPMATTCSRSIAKMARDRRIFGSASGDGGSVRFGTARPRNTPGGGPQLDSGSGWNGRHRSFGGKISGNFLSLRNGFRCRDRKAMHKRAELVPPVRVAFEHVKRTGAWGEQNHLTGPRQRPRDVDRLAVSWRRAHTARGPAMSPQCARPSRRSAPPNVPSRRLEMRNRVELEALILPAGDKDDRLTSLRPSAFRQSVEVGGLAVVDVE